MPEAGFLRVYGEVNSVGLVINRCRIFGTPARLSHSRRGVASPTCLDSCGHLACDEPDSLTSAPSR